MQKKDEIRTGKLEKLAKTINEMDNKAKGERKNLEEKLRHVEEGLFEWQYQLSMIVIFTEEFKNLSKDNQAKVKERLAKSIKENRQ